MSCTVSVSLHLFSIFRLVFVQTDDPNAVQILGGWWNDAFIVSLEKQNHRERTPVTSHDSRVDQIVSYRHWHYRGQRNQCFYPELSDLSDSSAADNMCEMLCGAVYFRPDGWCSSLWLRGQRLCYITETPTPGLCARFLSSPLYLFFFCTMPWVTSSETFCLGMKAQCQQNATRIVQMFE